MRYGTQHKERTRRRVLAEAAATIGVVGPNGIGVADLMAKAGLTHGGFYAHFKSKDDLVAQAIGQMFDDSYERFLECAGDADPAKGLSTFIDSYLCARHRDRPHTGCPIPSLAAEVARLPRAARERFAAGAERLTRSIAQLLRQLQHEEPDLLAASMVAELVGALTLSRAVNSKHRSNQILKASRDALKARLRRLI